MFAIRLLRRKRLYWEPFAISTNKEMKHFLAKVDKSHFSKNEFFKDFNWFTKTNFPEKKIVLIFD